MPKNYTTTRIKCDEDGWIILVNEDPEYPSYFHGLSPFQIETVKIKGDSEISYFGFGPKGLIKHESLEGLSNQNISFEDLTPAPPVGFNLTYECPEGFVFSHDWFATAFVMMTCQV